MYRQHVPYQASPLHWQDLAVAPETPDDHFFVAPNFVGVTKMGADLFGVCGERGTADERGVVQGDPLADKLGVGGVIGGGGGRSGDRGGWARGR